MTNGADPDQLADPELHCLQRQGISGFSRTRVNDTTHVGHFVSSLREMEKMDRRAIR